MVMVFSMEVTMKGFRLFSKFKSASVPLQSDIDKAMRYLKSYDQFFLHDGSNKHQQDVLFGKVYIDLTQSWLRQ